MITVDRVMRGTRNPGATLITTDVRAKLDAIRT